MLHLGRLINVNGLAVMTLERKTGSWLLLNLVLEDNGQRLVLRVPNLELVQQDIRDGAIAGEIYSIDHDDKLMTITADSTSLAQYIAGRPDFFGGAHAILVRN